MVKSQIVTDLILQGHDEASDDVLKVRDNLKAVQEQAQATAKAARKLNQDLQNNGATFTPQNNQYTQQMTAQSQQNIKTMEKLQKNEEKAAAKSNRKPNKVKRGISPGVGHLAVLGILGYGAEAQRLWSEAANSLKGTIDASEAQMKGYMDRSIQLANIFKFTPTQVLEAHEMLARTGFNEWRINASIPIVLEGAIAGNMSIEDVADKASDVMLAMGMNSENKEEFTASMQRLMDSITKTSQISNTSMPEAFQALKDAAPVFGMLKMDIEEGLALLATMANIGFKGERSGVATRTGLIRMINPPKPARLTLESLGINLRDFITVGEELKASNVVEGLKVYGVRTTQDVVNKHLNNDSYGGDIEKVVDGLVEDLIGRSSDKTVKGKEKITDAVFGTFMSRAQNIDFAGYLNAIVEAQAGPSALADLFGKRHYAKFSGPINAKKEYDYQTYVARLRAESSGSASLKAVTMQEGYAGQMMQMKSAFEALNISVWESGLSDTFTDGMKDITEMLREMSKTDPGRIDAIVKSIVGFAVGKVVVGGISDTAEALQGLGTAAGWVGDFGAEQLGNFNEFIRSFGGGAEIFANKMSAAGEFTKASLPYIAGIAAVGGALYWLSQRHDYLGEAATRNLDIYKKVREEFGLTAEAANNVLDVNATVAKFNAVQRLNEEKTDNAKARKQLLSEFADPLDYELTYSKEGTNGYMNRKAQAPWRGEAARIYRRLEGDTKFGFDKEKISVKEAHRQLADLALKYPAATDFVGEIQPLLVQMATSDRAVTMWANQITSLNEQIKRNKELASKEGLASSSDELALKNKSAKTPKLADSSLMDAVNKSVNQVTNTKFTPSLQKIEQSTNQIKDLQKQPTRLEGQAYVDVRLKVDGADVKSSSVSTSSSGHIKAQANLGQSMPELSRGPMR